MGWAARIGLIVVALAVVGTVAVAWYAGSLKPPHRTYHQVLTNDRFAH